MAQIGDASCPPRVYGCVLGVLVGRTVGIFNSFELLYDLVAGELCREFLEVKHLQCELNILCFIFYFFIIFSKVPKPMCHVMIGLVILICFGETCVAAHLEILTYCF